MADAAMKQVQEYKDSLISKGEQLIVKGFPAKIVGLNELLEKNEFQKKDMADIYQEINIHVPPAVPVSNNSVNCTDDGGPVAKRSRKDEDGVDVSGSRVYILPGGTVPCNQQLCDIIRIVKPRIRELVEDSNLLKMWISYMIPKIEDGNNFGVSIQEDTLAEIQSVESEAASFFDQISRYFISRAKVISKVAKYPHIADYRRAVQELDEKEYLSLWLVLCEIRNRYCSLHDIVIKNLEKIKKPRSSNTDAMY